jgi:hypothetical protein
MDTGDLELAESWAPRSCALPTAEQPLRVAEFDDLFASAVRRVERPGPGRVRLELEPTPQVAAAAAGLAVRETDCCSFFTFTLSATGGDLLLDVTVPPAHVGVLEALAARAAALAGRA